MVGSWSSCAPPESVPTGGGSAGLTSCTPVSCAVLASLDGAGFVACCSAGAGAADSFAADGAAGGLLGVESCAKTIPSVRAAASARIAYRTFMYAPIIVANERQAIWRTETACYV